MKAKMLKLIPQKQNIIRGCYEQLYWTTYKKWKKFLERYNFPRLNHEDIENLNRLITSKEIESIVKNLPANKSPGPDGFTGEFYQNLKNDTNSSQILLKIEETSKLKILPNSLYVAIITLVPNQTRILQEKKITGQYHWWT